MFGGDNHVCRAVESVGARCENAPVVLKPFCGVWPVEPRKPLYQLVGVCRYAQHPLAQLSSLNGEFANFALAVDYLFVGEDCPESRAPPYGLFVDVCEPHFKEAEENPLGPFKV